MASEQANKNILEEGKEEELKKKCEEEWYTYACGKEKAVLRLNHGSFGCAPLPVLEGSNKRREEWQKQPDEMYIEKLPQQLQKARELVASQINAPSLSLALVDNVTSASSVVTQNLLWDFIEGRHQKGDVVVLFKWTYNAVINSFKGTIERFGGKLAFVELNLPIQSPNDILKALETTLKTASEEEKEDGTKRKIAMAVFDHINSPSGLIFPLEEMVQLARQYKTEQVFVDGAHAIGQIPIDVEKLGVEYYTSNIHKWGLAPCSVAFLYVSPKIEATVTHSMISHNYGQGIGRESMWTGTKDYSPFLSVLDCFDFIESIGGIQALRERNHRVAVQGMKILEEGFGGQAEKSSPEKMVGSIILVALPKSFHISDPFSAGRLRYLLRHKYGIEIVVIAIGDGYLRVSCQLYNTIHDFEVLRDAVLQIEEKKELESENFGAIDSLLKDPEISPPHFGEPRKGFFD
eukprot:CAMPEP_0201505222 /NCGR_PEP_ID=MMETSP0151_2-20130828/85643_1 /ASSEMBLY_ACC=CAM_ASM_000257 /TAXON_ID=200890 /ORGANISM="Paramoeba atlantica, Strain 621/1 / CCAP 1560/9" /LENGTH=461 /DNA_ID=CAMNT_0047899057 /DNA_START=162 /DNA_END=1547 /DNA_ORIENTATION=+